MARKKYKTIHYGVFNKKAELKGTGYYDVSYKTDDELYSKINYKTNLYNKKHKNYKIGYTTITDSLEYPGYKPISKYMKAKKFRK